MMYINVTKPKATRNTIIVVPFGIFISEITLFKYLRYMLVEILSGFAYLKPYYFKNLGYRFR